MFLKVRAVLLICAALVALTAPVSPALAADHGPGGPHAAGRAASLAWRLVPSPNGSSSIRRNDFRGVSCPAADTCIAVGNSDPQSLAERWNGTAWSILATPQLSGVSASDVWAAGASESAPTALMMHWNGSGWTRVTAANQGSPTLSSVSADSASDAWAVGERSSPHLSGLNVVMHWNGTTWAQVPVPSPSKSLNGLVSVSAPAPDDVWAVGFTGNVGTISSAQVLHWNGTNWSQVPVPNASGYELLAVTALSPSDVWAVGEAFPSEHILILHWDGTSWTVAATAKAGGEITAVSALSPTDIWAVGECCGRHDNQSLVLHWNGTSWARQASPSPGGTADGSSNVLSGVSALSSTDAWAVGTYKHGLSQDKPLILHWNGTAWAQVASPSLGSGSGLDSVQVLSPTDTWATGTVFLHDGLTDTLILHWNGTAWTRS